MTAAASADGPICRDIGDISAHRRKHVDRAIGKFAERQYGLISLNQLDSLGIDRRAADKRVESGRLHRVHEGVFAVGHPLLTREGRWMAAVLACGPDAVLSHRSAAALWGLRRASSGPIDVTAPGRRGRSPAGIAAHRHGSLRLVDQTAERGIPCTSVARTLLDFAAVSRIDDIADAVVEAEIHRVLDLRAVKDVIAANPGRRGVARLRLVVSECDPRAERANPGLERRFLALCKRTGLPMPEVNVAIDLGNSRPIVDFLWRDAKLIVEADSREFHQNERAFEDDRLRDQRLFAAGWHPIRCTWKQVVDDPAELTSRLRGLLKGA